MRLHFVRGVWGLTQRPLEFPDEVVARFGCALNRAALDQGFDVLALGKPSPVAAKHRGAREAGVLALVDSASEVAVRRAKGAQVRDDNLDVLRWVRENDPQMPTNSRVLGLRSEERLPLAKHLYAPKMESKCFRSMASSRTSSTSSSVLERARRMSSGEIGRWEPLGSLNSGSA